ncbi:MAG TPA: S1C family serine protease [Steroidobacteraceae bacterium]|nr:S1C family serine protease [Steroidobacteraceae bacterium]
MSHSAAGGAAVHPKREDYEYELDEVLGAMVGIRALVPPDAFTADILGTERVGHGALIRKDGLVLTVGYLITEAETIWLSLSGGRTVPGHVLGYDQETGFGLVQALAHLDEPTLPLGQSSEVEVGMPVVVAGSGGRSRSVVANVIAKQEYAGYWEYLLEEAIYTSPPHPQWGGAALVSQNGRLIGVGSLILQEAVAGDAFDANMFVPIDLLDPILEDMLKLGRRAGPPRPWLGMSTTSMQGQLVVGSLTQGGPAHRAGVRVGDVVLEVAGQPVTDLGELFRKVWSVGPAGSDIPITLARGRSTSQVHVRSADRNDYLSKPRKH